MLPLAQPQARIAETKKTLEATEVARSEIRSGPPSPDVAAAPAETEASTSTEEARPSALTVPLPLEGHIKARGQDNPSYPQRQPVPDELVPWGAPFPGYAPEAWTHPDVLSNNRELSTITSDLSVSASLTKVLAFYLLVGSWS